MAQCTTNHTRSLRKGLHNPKNTLKKKRGLSVLTSPSKFGAGDEIRTRDPLVGNEMLYH